MAHLVPARHSLTPPAPLRRRADHDPQPHHHPTAALAVLLVLIAAACGDDGGDASSEPTATEAQAGSDEAVTITFWDNQQTASGLSEVQQTAIDVFEASHPNITDPS